MANREAKFAELDSCLVEAANLYVVQYVLIWEKKRWSDITQQPAFSNCMA